MKFFLTNKTLKLDFTILKSVYCSIVSFELFATSIIFLIIKKLFEFVYGKVPRRVCASVSLKPLVVLLVVKLFNVNINLFDFNEFV